MAPVLLRDIITMLVSKRNRWRKGIDHDSKTAAGRANVARRGRWRSLLMCVLVV